MGVRPEKESAGHKIMAALGFADDRAKEIEIRKLQHEILEC